jgi:hypothetical protein
MFGNASFAEQVAAGFLSPGNSVTPWSFFWTDNNRSEIGAYLRGDYGAPIKGVDMEVCYCPAFMIAGAYVHQILGCRNG